MKKGGIRIQKGGFSVDASLDRLLSKRVGGTVIFIGSVRGASPGGKVPHLDFQSYGAMAKSKLELIRERAMSKFAVEDVMVIHRIGRIPAGGRIVLIAASAAHREAAFRACRYVLEELKKRVPIWKKERGVWTGGEERRTARRKSSRAARRSR